MLFACFGSFAFHYLRSDHEHRGELPFGGIMFHVLDPLGKMTRSRVWQVRQKKMFGYSTNILLDSQKSNELNCQPNILNVIPRINLLRLACGSSV